MKLPPKHQKILNEALALKDFSPTRRRVSEIILGKDKVNSITEGISQLHFQASELMTLYSQFNMLFQSRGWLLSDSTNVETAKKALTLANKGKIDEAENLLTLDYEGKNLDFLLMRLNRLDVFKIRNHLLEEAAVLCKESRYIAAVPLILIVADGVGQDCFKKSLFSEGVDLIEVNALAGQEEGMNKLIQEICKTRQRLNTKEITFPYRNGILHGRDVNYGNKLVAAKAWSLLSIINDIVLTRQKIENEIQEPDPSLWEILKKYNEVEASKKLINEWKARPIQEPNWSLSSKENYPFQENTPEDSLVIFLKAWKSCNYGWMGEHTLYYDDRPIKKRAGQIREDFKKIQLYDAAFLKIQDKAPALTEIDCEITINCNEYKKDNFTFRLIYQDKDGNYFPTNKADGVWKIYPNYQNWAFQFSLKS